MVRTAEYRERALSELHVARCNRQHHHASTFSMACCMDKGSRDGTECRFLFLLTVLTVQQICLVILTSADVTLPGVASM